MTCQDTFAPSYSASATSEAGAVAELVEERKIAKYADLSQMHHFSPVAVETTGVFEPQTKTLIMDLRRPSDHEGYRGGSSHNLPHSETVSGCTAGQQCINDGYHRPAQLGPVWLT